MAAKGDNNRLALLDEIEGLEKLLESDASWVAWRALDRLLARGAGPRPEEAGADIGQCIARLCTNPHYMAWLAAHERLRESPAAISTEVPRTKGRRRSRAAAVDEPATAKAPPVGEAPPGFSAAAVGPAPPFTPMPPLIRSSEPELPQPAPLPAMSQSSLLERIARLEKEAVGLKPLADAMALQRPAPPPRPVPLVVEEAELTIVVPDDGAETDEPVPARGLLARLERIADSLASKPSATKGPALQAEEAEVEIVTGEDDDTDARPSVPPRARSSHEH